RMNQLAVALLIGLLVGGLAGWKAESWHMTQAEQAAVIGAQAGVIKTEQKQAAVTNKTEVDYEKDLADIERLYFDGLPASIPGRVPVVASPAASTGTYSKKYHLSPKQCDIEEGKLKGLWSAWQQMRELNP
ncbi:MAG: hypothetical protein KGL39_55725, partial [Patescibacteria group bacterium]|nr:hypothetical protein [Patescibacteria group bacterium]